VLRVRRDVEVVSAGRRQGPTTERAAKCRAQVVILGRDDAQAARALLRARPQLVVLTLADAELMAWRYVLTPYRERLGELSPAALTAVIRAREQLPAWWSD